MRTEKLPGNHHTQNIETKNSTNIMDNPSVFPHGIKTGVIAGIAAILVTLLAYVLNINMLGWAFQGVSYLVLIGVMIYGLLGFRKANGGYMAFAQGILIVLTAGMICAVINYFFGLLYYNVIDPGFEQQVIENSLAAYEKMGITVTDQVEELIRANAEDSTHFSWKYFSFAIVGALIVWTILGLILGAIFSKKDPNDIL